MTSELSSFQQQYQALRNGSGFVELAGWSSLTFTGADRLTLLNNFCTNDVKHLNQGDHREAFVTNVKGKTIGHGLIYFLADELVYVTVPNQAAKLMEHFDRYIIREDVHLRDTTVDRAYFHICMLPPIASARWIGWKLLNPESGALLEVPAADAARLRQIARERNYTPCQMAAFESLRIEAGMPLFGVDFDDNNFPQEVDRDRQAISFTKGCYLGQETVARIDALGHVNQKLVGVQFSGSQVPAVGTELSLGDKTVGQVTSATFSPRLNAPLALAMLRREANAVRTRLESPVGACEVVALPIVADRQD
jgi:folate-binding protein YgfZ